MGIRYASSHRFKYCPECGSEVEQEEFTVRTALINGERTATKKNTRVVCPKHGELIVKSM